MTRSHASFTFSTASHGLLGLVVFAVAFFTYASTVPPVQVPGDPSEYTFIPWILGIAHPPGYAFYTLLAALWQHLLPIGIGGLPHAPARRDGGRVVGDAGLFDRAAVDPCSLSVSRQRPAVKTLRSSSHSSLVLHLPALFAGLSLAAATDVWQHSIHTNAHIITLLLATSSVFLLIQWWSTGKDRWLYRLRA